MFGHRPGYLQGRVRGLWMIVLIVAAATVSTAIAQPIAPLETIDDHIATFRYDQALISLRARPDSNRFEILSRKASAHNFLGMDYIAEGRKAEAEAEFMAGLKSAQVLLDEFGDRADSQFLFAALRGNLALFRGGRGKVRLGRDVEHFSKAAIQIDSTHVDAHVVLGVFYREAATLTWLERTAARTFFGGLPKASLDQSLGVLDRAISLDPYSAFARFERGQTLLALGRNDDAYSEFETLLQLEPVNSQDLRNQKTAREILTPLGNP